MEGGDLLGVLLVTEDGAGQGTFRVVLSTKRKSSGRRKLGVDEVAGANFSGVSFE